MSRTILLLDDDHNARNVLAESLARRGFDVKGAGSAAEARKLLGSGEIDALVTDVILADGTAYDLISELRGSGHGADLPVVLMSNVSKSSGEREFARRRYRALDFLIKPFPVEALINPLGKVLGIAPEDLGVRHAPVDDSKRGRKLAGELHETTFSKLFCHFHLSRSTGTLRLSREESERQIYFVSGSPVFATSNAPTETLGRHLLGMGWINTEQYQRGLEEHRKRRQRFGETLVEMGVVPAEELYKAIRFHIREKILAAFGAGSGHYEFEHGDAFLESIDNLDYNPYDLFLTGVRRFYPPDLLARELSKLYNIPLSLSERGKKVAATGFALSAEETRVFSLFQEGHSLSSILEERPDRAAVALPMLYIFLLLGVLEPKRVPKAAEQTPAPQDEWGIAQGSATGAGSEADPAIEAGEQAIRRHLATGASRGVESENGDSRGPLLAHVLKVKDAHRRLATADFYELLGIRMNATDSEIAAACEERLMELEPPETTNGSIPESAREAAETLRARLAHARQTLLNEEERARYDQQLIAKRNEEFHQAELAFLKGKELLENNRLAEAEKALRMACDLNAEDSDSYAYLALVIFLRHAGPESGTYRREALDMLESVLSREPGCTAARYAQARIALAEGRILEARRGLADVLAGNPSHPEAQQLLEHIDAGALQ